MKNYQATCEDGWKSKTVKAGSIDQAADMVADELVAHVKTVHSMDLPTEPKELHQAVVDHMTEV
ncbi:hypothetical protein HY310_02555 [Candidatus Microgenomates bacterium]|nr:hypothetical protein [Candidatus Microgenomates bacterium]